MTLHAKQSTGVVSTEARRSCFHVYRVGGILGDNRVIKADDRKTPRYYLKGTRLAASWQFSLHMGGQDGVLVCHVQSPYIGPPMMPTNPRPIHITFGPERQIIQVHRGTGSRDGTYSFNGLDGDEYRWQPSSQYWASRMECLNSQGQVVATFRITFFAVFKDGELRIHQPAQPMADLFVATCLAIRMPDY